MSEPTQADPQPTGSAAMPAAWLEMAADLLGIAADKFSNRGCSDLDYPAGWTEEARAEFNTAVWLWDSGGRTIDPEEAGRDVPDWLAMRFLAERLRLALTPPPHTTPSPPE